MVKTSPASAGAWGSVLIWEIRSHVALGQKTQTLKQKQCCDRFNKDLKNFIMKNVRCPRKAKKNNTVYTR